jgi:hypothetical protein
MLAEFTTVQLPSSHDAAFRVTMASLGWVGFGILSELDAGNRHLGLTKIKSGSEV